MAKTINIKETETISNLVTDCYDYRDHYGYYKYLEGIKSVGGDGEDTATYVEARKDSHGTITMLVLMRNDHDNWFVPFSHMSPSQQEEIARQVEANKGTRKEKYISTIMRNFQRGFDLPKNFAVESIKELLLDKQKGGGYMIGETGLSIDGDDGGICISVFFPTREDPAFSYDRPLDVLPMEDIEAIYEATLRIANKKRKC